MGSLETTYDLAKDLTIVKGKGKIRAQDFLNWIAEYYYGKVTTLILWDLTEADLADVSMDQVKEVAVEATKKADVRKGGKSAFVFSRDVEFGLARAFETHSELQRTPLQYGMFRDIYEAREWLGVD